MTPIVHFQFIDSKALWNQNIHHMYAKIINYLDYLNVDSSSTIHLVFIVFADCITATITSTPSLLHEASTLSFDNFVSFRKHIEPILDLIKEKQQLKCKE